MRTKLTVVVILSGLFLLIGACNPSSPAIVTPMDIYTPAGYTYINYTGDNTTVPGPTELRLDKLIWGPYSISFFGSTGIPKGIRLNNQLYKDNQAVDWWPEYLHMQLDNGTWEFSVKSHGHGAPDEFPGFGQGYSLQIWGVDIPTLVGQFSLDSPGPPLETRIPDSDGLVTTELEGSKWQLVSLNGTGLLPGTTITLEFSEGKATGMSDCNRYGGGYAIKAPNLINIYELMNTELSCGELSDKQSEVYLQHLAKAICYRVVDNRLILYDVITNTSTLVFERQQ